MFKGSITALITPFRNGAVDEAAFRNIIDRQIAEGTQGLVPCGTTGESPTLSHSEHRRVTEICIDAAKKRVIVGATVGFLVWFFGFMVIGGEWFLMWQSDTWNGQDAAFKFYMAILGVLIFVNQPDRDLA